MHCIFYHRYKWWLCLVGDYVQMVTMLRQWLLILMVTFWISVSDLCRWCSVGDHRFSDLFSEFLICIFGGSFEPSILVFPACSKSAHNIRCSRSLDFVLLRSTWYLVLICAEAMPDLWSDNIHMIQKQCNNHIQKWWNLDPIWSHAFAYITWLTTCLTYMFCYFQGIIFASLVLNSSIPYLRKIKIKARKFLGNDRTWHDIHSCTPCIFMHPWQVLKDWGLLFRPGILFKGSTWFLTAHVQGSVME